MAKQNLNSLYKNIIKNFRIILVQNAPEKPLPIPSPNFALAVPPPNRRDLPSQVVASIECNAARPPLVKSDSRSTMHKSDTELDMPEDGREPERDSISSYDALELNIQEILALDVDCGARKAAGSQMMAHTSKTESRAPNRALFKSLPNLSASSENLLV